MSQESVEIVRRVYDALNRGDWDAALRDAHPDFEMTTQRGLDAGTLRRREVVQRFVQDYIRVRFKCRPRRTNRSDHFRVEHPALQWI